MSQLHVLFDDPPEGGFREHLLSRINGPISMHWSSADVAPESLHVLVKGRPEGTSIERFSNLSHLIIPYAGVPEHTRKLMSRHPQVSVHNLHHNAAPTAEFALSLLLAAAKRVVPIDAELRHHDWSSRYAEDRAMLLEGKRVLVLGLGAIGQRVARLLRAFGMEVSGLRRDANRACADVSQVIGIDGLDDALPLSDVVMVCLPATEQTRGLLDARRIGLLKSTSVLVNIARGDLVDEKALFEALQSRSIGAAGIDVWYRYPKSETERSATPPSKFPFETLDNVVLSPHRGGHCDDTERLRAAALAEVLNAIALGESVPNAVDLSLGY